MALPDLDCLIAEADRRCDTAHRSGGQEQPDWLALLAAATQLAGEVQAPADNLVEDYVEHCRIHGFSWTDIGAALGVTRQAVQQRFQTPHKRYTPRDDDRRPPPGDGPCQAGGGAAPQQLPRHRAPAPGTPHRSVEARLSMGASHAAERVAWTPHSRKAIAIAGARSEHHGSERIGCEDLLNGLAQVGREVAAGVLTEVGFDPAALDAPPADTDSSQHD
jgi:hypothetical protein